MGFISVLPVVQFVSVFSRVYSYIDSGRDVTVLDNDSTAFYSLLHQIALTNLELNYDFDDHQVESD